MATVVARGIQGGLRPAWRRSAQVQMQYGRSTLRAASSSTVSTGPQNGPRHSDLAPWYRSCLFVPGDSERKLRKSVECGADLCILDLDDGVGHDKKVYNLICKYKINHGCSMMKSITTFSLSCQGRETKYM